MGAFRVHRTPPVDTLLINVDERRAASDPGVIHMGFAFDRHWGRFYLYFGLPCQFHSTNVSYEFIYH